MAAKHSKSTSIRLPEPAGYPITLREALRSIPRRELDAQEFLIVRASNRAKGGGFSVEGCGNIAEMIVHAAWHARRAPAAPKVRPS